MTELIRVTAGHYATPDERWRVQRNTDGTVCAPLRWWQVIDTTGHYPLKAAVPTLAHAEEFLARALPQVAEIDAELKRGSA